MVIFGILSYNYLDSGSFPNTQKKNYRRYVQQTAAALTITRLRVTDYCEANVSCTYNDSISNDRHAILQIIIFKFLLGLPREAHARERPRGIAPLAPPKATTDNKY